MHVPTGEASYLARAVINGPTSSLCYVPFPREMGFSFPPVLTKAKGKEGISVFPSGGRGGGWKLITSHARSVSKCLGRNRQGGVFPAICKCSVFFHGEGFEGKIDSRAVSNRVACTAHVEFFGNDLADRSYGGATHLLKLPRDKEHLCARCECMNAGIAVHALNPEELPDVDKPL